MLNYIWIGFFLISFLVGLLKVFLYQDTEVFSAMMKSTFSMAETAFNISIGLTGALSLWLGIMKVGEKGGAINVIAKLITPLFSRIFPEVPKGHPATGSMIMNFSANMLGLDNAATPLGLKAMNELQELNPNKDTASNAQIMFLVLNTSGLTIIPVSIMALRATAGAANPADVFIPILLATYFASLTGLIITSIFQKINLFNGVVFSYLGGLTALICLLIWYLTSLPQDQVASISSFAANFILLSIIVSFISLALRKKVNVYETFIDGAKEGFNVAIKIIPYLVAMLVAIGVFRASGTLDILIEGIAVVYRSIAGIFTSTVNDDFIGALPTAFMKPLSGSGARAMMVETFEQNGVNTVDSFVARLSSVFQGSTETTFYTLAVYYGAVNIKNTRYTVACGLLADLAGIIAAIFIAYLFFH